jgi:uncharacterized protein YbdZ (MbtH family)
MKGYARRQATMDHINQRWDRIIRGVEVYHDPIHNEDVELPSGWNYAWRSKSGEYLMNSNGNFDPNELSNGSWDRMERVPQ